jgi:4-diphosphocytidyl-2-C-methyl-D-erythritol kinase
VKVTVPSFAKLNLDLRVLGKRSDGYHELRTIFQTISLHDTLAIDFETGKETLIELDSSIDIPDNLVARAARAVFDHLRITGSVRFALRKRIPMGAGMGGGSSNAAAVLMALPALAGQHVAQADLVRLAESLGSDVPFFLFGGTAVGLGRGTELYPMPDQPARPVVVVHEGIHVSTAEAYRALERTALTSPPDFPMLGEFQTIAWSLAHSDLSRLGLKNDFEEPVFKTHRELASVVQVLRRCGASPALMTGSGSAVFGIFQSAGQARAASEEFEKGTAMAARFVTRKQYRAIWRRSLGAVASESCFAD